MHWFLISEKKLILGSFRFSFGPKAKKLWAFPKKSFGSILRLLDVVALKKNQKNPSHRFSKKLEKPHFRPIFGHLGPNPQNVS